MTQLASLECISGGASRAESRNGTPGCETLATGLDEMLDVDLAASAERAVGNQRDFQAAALETWLSRVPEIAPLRRRLVCSLGQSPGNTQRAVTTPALTRPRQGASRDGSLGQGAAREMCDRARGPWVTPHWVSDGVTASHAPHWNLHCNSASGGSSVVYSSY